MLLDLYIDNADCLLNYDMPLKKDVFSIRFSVFQDSNTSFVVSYYNIYYLRCMIFCKCIRVETACINSKHYFAMKSLKKKIIKNQFEI